MAKKPTFGELNSAEFSQEPESLEPENLSGIDLIAKNNQDATKPKVIKKIVGSFKGLVFKAGPEDPVEVKKSENNDSWLGFMNSNSTFTKHRVYIPELHAHLPDIGEDLENVPIEIASLYPYFVAQSTEIQPLASNTLVWCDFIDRENFKDPILIGPVDDKKKEPAGGTAAGGGGTASGGGLAGSAGAGDPFGGASYKNAAGQVSYPSISGDWTGKLPENGFTATEATVQQLVDLALQQVGKKEDPKGTNGGPQIDEFNGGRKEAWCAASLAFLFRKINAPLPGDKIPSPGPNGWNDNHSVQYIQKVFTALGYFYQEPKVGDMIIYDTSEDPNTVNSSMHIGLVTEVNGDLLRTVEFNWGDEVTKTYQDWRNGMNVREDGSKYKSKYKINGYARRPLPYAGVPDGKLVQAPVDSVAGPLPKEGANHPFYYIAEGGKVLPNPIEMVYIRDTRKLYPKKYIRALYAMMDAYKSQRGKNLVIVSAYRDIEQQRVLFEQFLARNRAPPQVAPPGKSLHNNGLAIDIDMSDNRINYSGNYTSFAINNNITNTSNKQDIFRRVANGDFGPVAQWLVNNCGKFGFYWDGWSYRELWHYQLNVSIARSAGLIDD